MAGTTASTTDDAPINANKLVNAVYEWYIQEKWAVAPPQSGFPAFLELTATGIPNSIPTIGNISTILTILDDNTIASPSLKLRDYLNNQFWAGRCYGLTLKERKNITITGTVTAANALNFYNPIIDCVVEDHAVDWYEHLLTNDYLFNLYKAVLPNFTSYISAFVGVLALATPTKN